jgi:hypothetical protein
MGLDRGVETELPLTLTVGGNAPKIMMLSSTSLRTKGIPVSIFLVLGKQMTCKMKITFREFRATRYAKVVRASVISSGRSKRNQAGGAPY